MYLRLRVPLLKTLTWMLLASCSHRARITSDSQLNPNWSQAYARSSKFVVSTQSQRASLAGLQMVERGGNIIDAFVATSFVLAVEQPYATGIGGGGFLLFYDAKSRKVRAFDFREKAPGRAHERMFLKADGTVDGEKSITGVHSAGVPGLVSGVLEVHRRFGKLPLDLVLAPAIRLAQEGFELSQAFAKTLEGAKDRLGLYSGSRAVFFKGNRPMKAGDLLVQQDLAETLKRIATHGSKEFYKGQTAKAMVSYLQEKGGVHSLADFAKYQTKERPPIKGSYRGYTIYGMPPPSSGGVLLQQILKTVEPERLQNQGPLEVSNVHKIVVAMQTAFADRGKYFGDTDHVAFSYEKLLSPKWIKRHQALLRSSRALSADAISSAKEASVSPDHTIHFSMADGDGNVLASTQTINGTFGSAVVVPGTGVLMNNEMDDFSSAPGASNMFGAFGSEANKVEPHKRPLSSMTPTLIFQGARPIYALGSPNGTRIISCVSLATLNLLEFGMNLQQSIAAPRYHHQWRPDELWVEPYLPHALVTELEALGYKVEKRHWGCRVQAVGLHSDGLEAVADPRGTAAALGY